MKKSPTLIYIFKIKISLFLFCLKINKNKFIGRKRARKIGEGQKGENRIILPIRRSEGDHWGSSWKWKKRSVERSSSDRGRKRFWTSSFEG